MFIEPAEDATMATTTRTTGNRSSIVVRTLTPVFTLPMFLHVRHTFSLSHPGKYRKVYRIVEHEEHRIEDGRHIVARSRKKWVSRKEASWGLEAQ